MFELISLYNISPVYYLLLNTLAGPVLCCQRFSSGAYNLPTFNTAKGETWRTCAAHLAPSPYIRKFRWANLSDGFVVDVRPTFCYKIAFYNVCVGNLVRCFIPSIRRLIVTPFVFPEHNPSDLYQQCRGFSIEHFYSSSLPHLYKVNQSTLFPSNSAFRLN